MRPKPNLGMYQTPSQWPMYDRDLTVWAADAMLEAAERIERALTPSPPRSSLRERFRDWWLARSKQRAELARKRTDAQAFAAVRAATVPYFLKHLRYDDATLKAIDPDSYVGKVTSNGNQVR